MEVKRLRSAIDKIDTALLALLNKRAKVTLAIGKVKAARGEPAYAPDREAAVYRRLGALNKGPLSATAVQAIYREIMSGTLELEKPLTIAYLGPEFTFTHLASMKKFGSSVQYAGCNTISDVFAEVEKARADFGVVPIENSIEGAVNHTFDMFMDSDLKICSEVFLEISHHLLSKSSHIRAIKRVYSKAEVFGQCRLWLESNLPRVELVETSSTARAAAIAATERSAACIASELAGKRYRLKTLDRSIEDSSHNVTRFLVISRAGAKPSVHDKTSIMVSVKDKVGALHTMLVPFKRHGINLTKIESRPSKVRAWEYYFFIDMLGHASDAKVARALAELGREATYMKILGSYPMAQGV